MTRTYSVASWFFGCLAVALAVAVLPAMPERAVADDQVANASFNCTVKCGCLFGLTCDQDPCSGTFCDPVPCACYKQLGFACICDTK